MSSKYLRNTVAFFAVVVLIFGVFVSCENPFTRNLGEKVDVEWPTITLRSPAPASILKGTVQFQGVATAYREVRRVEVRILNSNANTNKEKPYLLPWTRLADVSGESTEKKWTYDLDTLDTSIFEDQEDGFLKIQFRASDPNLTIKDANLQTYVYIIKNKPSEVKMSQPSEEKLNAQTASRETKKEIRGQIIDRRGIKPGFPRIKIWPDDMPEPSGDDLNWGWVTMFLSTVDNTTDPDPENNKPGDWSYADRSRMVVVNQANFAFKLAKFSIVETHDKGGNLIREARYEETADGFQGLPVGKYKFRIRTSDTFFYSNEDEKNNPLLKYKYPRAPQEDEEEIVGYEPKIDEDSNTNPEDEGHFWYIDVKSSGQDPEIELDNKDLSEDPALPENTPNIYITESSSIKISTGNDSREIFRLRILTSHDDGIEYATLRWDQPGSGRLGGTLIWDDIGSKGYVDGDPLKGHYGALLPTDSAGKLKHFVFTATEGLTDEDGNKVFIPGNRPYQLEVTVYSVGEADVDQRYRMQRYNVTVSDYLPKVKIDSVKGAYAEPSALKDYYTVNGNIEVFVDANAGMGINTVKDAGKDRELIKWIVEPESSTVIQNALDIYQNYPTAASLQFFNNIMDVTSASTAMSGWADTGSFKFNATPHNGQNLWLYIIAQDGAQRLGYTKVKLYVDESTDIPELAVGLDDTINDKSKLLIAINDDQTQTGSTQARRNMLDNTSGIDLTFKDDDGINTARNITIKLTDDNARPLSEKTLTVSQIQGMLSGSGREWSGSLSQQIMAKAMYGETTTRTYLRDGIYKLEISYSDDNTAKVNIPGTTVVSVPGAPKTICFCVISEDPVISKTSPDDNSFQTSMPVDITGTVTSRVPLQKIWISFNPSVTGYDGSELLPLSSGVWDDDPNASGEYVYSWSKTGVVFVKTPVDFPEEERRFSLETVDIMGNFYSPIAPWTVRVDYTPPTVARDEFYFSRLLEINRDTHRVNGKFNFKISAQDNNSIRQENDDVYVRWWIARADAANVPDWDTTLNTPNGMSGQFKTTDDPNKIGLYEAIIDSRNLTDNTTYCLYAAAEDSAGNISNVKNLETFDVDQSSDLPALDPAEMSPVDKKVLDSPGGVLKISGKATDDDGFKTANRNSYVRIRFGTSATGPFNAWANVSANLVEGALVFDYQVPAGQLSTDGWKYYQIQVTDEADNKNPDNVINISAAQKIFPTNTTTYSFFLKNSEPVIHFSQSGENSYKTRADVLSALAGGWVKDNYLASVTVSFDRGTVTGTKVEELLGNPNGQIEDYFPGITSQFDWILSSAGLNWMPADSAITEGMHTVIITARDEAGHTVSAEWKFYKDITGPVITANIVQKTSQDYVVTLPVIAGESGAALSITGRFDDEYSAIKKATYRFDTNAFTDLPSGNITNVTNNGKTANWTLPVPTTLGDGRHRFTLTAYDQLDNTASVTDWYFVVDRTEPVLIGGTAAMNVNIGGNLIGPIDDETTRVFGAASVSNTSNTVIFTLSGMASDATLNDITVAFRNGSETNTPVLTLKLKDLALLPTPALGLPVPPQPTWAANTIVKSLDTPEQRLTVVATTIQNRWNWTLNVLEKDLYALSHSTGYGPGVPCFISVNAQDLGQHNSGTEHWRFYLDTTPPVIEFSNITTDGKTVFDGANITMTGTVNDDNRVYQIEYYLKKWDYTTGAFKFGSSNGNWGGTTEPWEPITPSAAGWASSASWSLTAADFFADVYGSDIFTGTKGEGRYELHIRATDMSLGAGNPQENKCEFFVDRSDPTIVWDANAQKSFYRNKSDGSIQLTFTVTDSNYIENPITAVITGTGGRALTSGEISAAPTTFDASTGIYTQVITLNPILATPNWADGKYTLTLTVKDGAGKTASVDNTREFTVDNKAPSIQINGEGSATEPPTPATAPIVTIKEAVTGRTPLRGVFNANASGSPVYLVAFYVAPNGSVAPSNLTDLTTKDTDITAASLTGAGWHYADSSHSDVLLTDDGTNLMTINAGLKNVNMLIPNASRLTINQTINGDPTRYAALDANVSAVSGGVTFNGVALAGTEQVNLLKIYFLVMDEAGNRNINEFNYQIYPEGDRPKVTLTNPNENDPLEKRLLNGTIRIGGTAKDNVRVKNVWFRILDATTKAPITHANFIHGWDQLWNEDTNTWQQPQTKTIVGTSPGTNNGGWYMANGGGKPDVPWYAYINRNGELDPLQDGKKEIIIEVFAEDAMYDEDGVTVITESTTGLYSRLKSPPVSAYVVKGAPVFGDERIYKDASAAETDFNKWETIQTANLRGRASYSVTVTHETGVKEITWTPPSAINSGNPINLFNTGDPYNTPVTGTYFTNLNGMDQPSPTGPGIAVRAGPKSVITGSQTLATNKKYLIWKWSSSPPPALTAVIPDYGSFPANTDWSLAAFTPSAAASVSLGSIELMEANADGKFEWVVVVDVHADLIDGGKYKAGYLDGNQTLQHSGYSSLDLRATENSKSVSLYSDFKAKLPIDNQPPAGAYTHNPYVAGEAATFGGDAGDNGAVSGLSRIVLWFSANRSGAEKSIPWFEQNSNGTGSGKTFASQPTPAGITLPSGVDFPAIPAKGAANGINYSCIVIEANDPLGNNTVYGHKLPMGFATVGGELSTAWYVTLDSMLIQSGRVTAHYVVYDKAGNFTYYSQKLVVMNGVPRITRITLATDIRGDKGLTGASGSFNGNKTYGDSSRRLNTPADAVSASPMGTIATAFPGLTNIQQGISDPVTINTSDVRDYGVVYDQAFNVRNKLLAVKVEIDQPLDSKGRTFRLEYVSGAKALTGYTSGAASGTLKDIKAGRIYIINEPGSAVNKFPWGSFGAQVKQDELPKKGAAFMAIENGADLKIPDVDYAFGAAAPSAWELNSDNYNTSSEDRDNTYVPSDLKVTLPNPLKMSDVAYNTTPDASGTYGKSAEFVYAAGAFDATQFGTNGTTGAYGYIHDFRPVSTADGRPADYPAISPVLTGAQTAYPWAAHSLFIIRVFGGSEDELFGDFALLSIRVNNDDKTQPYAQLYDLNPKTEGQDSTLAGADSAERQLTALSISSIGGNRTKGGLWNTGTVQKVAKSGHIEPRRTTNLTSSQMGGAASLALAAITKPFLAEGDKTAKLFEFDTVSGDVILRGYVEDDQRVQGVTLTIGTTSVPILTRGTNNFTLAAVAGEASRVKWHETVDLNRNRVEWAYLWRTESVPANTIVGDITVSATANNAGYNNTNSTFNSKTASPTVALSAANATYNYFNPDYATSMPRYNQIPVHVRPYITGFLRNQSTFAHSTRSRQGRYMFARGETAVVTGFNLGGGNTTNPIIYLPGMGDFTTLPVGTIGNFGITTANDTRYRQFTVDATAATGAGIVTYRVTSGSTAYNAVNTNNGAANTGSERRITAAVAGSLPIRPTSILPWNIEYSPGTDGSELWDDFTQVHIWQSDDTTGTDGGRFTSANNQVILNPAMSIDPTNGDLYESHNQTGTGGSPIGTNYNTGNLKTSRYDQTGVQLSVMQTSDPIFFSDVYFSPGISGAGVIGETGGTGAIAKATWAVSSIIGRSGTRTYWNAYGGIYLHGPEGKPVTFTGGSNANNNDPSSDRNGSLYYAESAWYNNSSNSTSTDKVDLTDQFMNPHIVTSYTGTGTNTQERIHVSYYDVKDGSIKYRYNRRGQAGNTIHGGDGTNTAAITANNAIPKMWVNLDGKYDYEDTVATSYAAGEFGFTSAGTINANDRVVRTGRATVNAGKYNAIAVTSQGYPVIAYYDETNQRLKLAVSRSTAPIRNTDWVIRDYVIPSDNLSSFGTGEFVSMKIDTSNNRVHIAAMNTNKRLVYITGILNPTAGTGNTQQTDTDGTNVLTGVTVQVVDSVGNVGRWCALSLDKDGNPWISYMDESYIGARDGAKVAYLNKTTFYKGVAGSGHFPGEYIDLYGESLEGWETMHVPTLHRVENPVESGREHGRLGMECFPTRNVATTNTKIWSAAVSYLSHDAETGPPAVASMDRYRIAYYVK